MGKKIVCEWQPLIFINALPYASSRVHFWKISPTRVLYHAFITSDYDTCNEYCIVDLISGEKEFLTRENFLLFEYKLQDGKAFDCQYYSLNDGTFVTTFINRDLYDGFMVIDAKGWQGRLLIKRNKQMTYIEVCDKYFT